MTKLIQTAESDDTETFGELIGRNLRGGEIIELISDLGGGKTTLTRGMVRGAGSKDVVASPTFAISKVYRSPNYDIYHYDFYRLSDAGILEYELHDQLNDPSVVVIIEWGDIVKHVLPARRMTINIDAEADGTRSMACRYPTDLEYLLI